MENKINDGGAALYKNIATDAFPYGAIVKCNQCGYARELTVAYCAVALRQGWPTCCGYTMTLEKREEQS